MSTTTPNADLSREECGPVGSHPPDAVERQSARHPGAMARDTGVEAPPNRWLSDRCERQSLVVRGVPIHWREYGRPSKRPPVVMLHGLSDSHLTWKRAAALLAQDRRILLPDLPGHGLSGRPDASYELEWYSDVMGAWLVAAGLSEVDLVGHSFGGGVAQMMLLTSRQRIRRLALVAAGGLGREISLALRMASIPFVVEYFGQPFMQVGTHIALRCVRDGRTAQEITLLSKMNARSGSARAFARTVQDLMNWRGQRHSFHRRVHEVGELPPMQVIWGARDPIIPVAHGRALADATESLRFVIFDRCGHFPHQERPGLFVRELRQFLDEAEVPAVRLRSSPCPVRVNS